MNLTDYVRILWRRGWIILLAMALTAGSAYLFSKRQTPIYRSEAKILIKPARTDNGLQLAMRNSLQSYVAWLNTGLRAQMAIDDLKLDMTADQLSTKVKATASLDDFLLIIDVDLPDGDVANQVASSYIQHFIDWRNQENASQQLQDRVYAERLDPPKPGLFSPNTSANTLAGALLGVIVGGIVVFVLEFIESNVLRSTTDVERFLELQVLGSLPTAE
jgi:capsular polysaccharide biosynthesis protein